MANYSCLNDALAEMSNDISRHMILQHPSHSNAAAVWAACTFLMDRWTVFPKFYIHSPERECGKTTLLELMEAMVKNPEMAGNVTASAFFRMVELSQPTFLIDEADITLKNNDQMLAIMNASHRRRTAYKILSDPTNTNGWTPKKWSTWTAQVIAGIGDQADTLMSRSICVNLRRKMVNERVDTIPSDFFEQKEPLRNYLARWATNVELDLCAGDLPSGGSDRAKDNWRPLMIVAKQAGGLWLDKIETAFTAMEVGKKSIKSIAIGTELLADVQRIMIGGQYSEISASEMRNKLVWLEDAEWGQINRGGEITQKWLSKTLKSYGVETHRTREANIYKLGDLNEAFSRYLTSL
jgi:hypothetical protein